MTSVNNILKAIDSLESLLQNTNTSSKSSTSSSSSGKSEKTSYCLTIVNGICSRNFKNSRSYGKNSLVLGLSIKTLLIVCNDNDADVRTVADECLNKIIRCQTESNVSKIQYEFFNEIQRNGNWRSLRAALKRFGILSHTIKPAKGKPYICNLIPCIETISKRTEESVIDTLSESLPLILKSLGLFMTDKETKVLLKAFYPNLSSSLATFRRHSSNMILTTCLNCKKPKVYLFYVLRYLIDTLIPISNVDDNVYLIIGLLNCLRIMLPHIDRIEDDELESDSCKFDSLLQIYELCLRYVQWHSDHNVVNVALETLAQLLNSNNDKFISKLTAENGINFDSEINTIDINNKEQNKKLNIGCINDCQIPLKYCCRYLASSFLLTGCKNELISDKIFRVSVKSLTLTCIGHIIKYYPNILLNTLEKENSISNLDNCQMISDILLFSKHSDPQLRGNVCIIVGHFFNSIYRKFYNSYEIFKIKINQRYNNELLTLDNLISIIIKGLNDESAITCRQALIALNMCINSILESDDHLYGLIILNNILFLSNNLYFLVKINLCKVLGELPYITISYLTGNSKFQDNALNILMKLLNDQDPRVRNAASDGIIKFIQTGYFKKIHGNELIYKSKISNDKYNYSMIPLNNIKNWTYSVEHNFFLNGLDEPFNLYYKNNNDKVDKKHLENNLSIIINLLTDKLYLYPCKYFIYGCFECLNKLSNYYPTTVYPRAWDCKLIESSTTSSSLTIKNNLKIHSSNRSINSDNMSNDFILINNNSNNTNNISPMSKRLLSLILSMLTSDQISYDLSCHKWMIILCGNLISGIAMNNFKHNSNQDYESVNKLWNLFDDNELNINIELLLKHIMRLINIYIHAIDDIAIPIVNNKSTLSSFTSQQSFILKNKKTSSSSSSSSINSNSSSGTTGGIGIGLGIGLSGIQLENKSIKDKLSIDKSPINSSKLNKLPAGYFYLYPHYIKLHEILKASHLNYNSSLDIDASQMYIELLNSILKVLSLILEISTLYEAKNIAEELLNYFESTLILSPKLTIKCVRQLLKTLFGMNLKYRWSEIQYINKYNHDNDDDDDDDDEDQDEINYKGDYINNIINIMNNNNLNDNESDMNKGWSNSPTFLTRKDSEIASFISIFEPMVIKSLNLYTTTNCVLTQCEVLDLLNQLIIFHVNYCLLDADKKFINFVFGQFPYIQESLIIHTELLLPKIFTFLILLSYEKYHSKMLIDLREIIKLCDGLMTSGQPLKTHFIPSIIPVTEDIFFVRLLTTTTTTTAAATATTSSTTKSPTALSELETTQEYLLTNLLKLCEYNEVIKLLSNCLYELKYLDDGGEKWKKWSTLILNNLLKPSVFSKIQFENNNINISLIKLFSSSYFNVKSNILKNFFIIPPVIEESFVKFEKWLAMLNITYLLLLTYVDENDMLEKLTDLKVYMHTFIPSLDLYDSFFILNDERKELDGNDDDGDENDDGGIDFDEKNESNIIKLSLAIPERIFSIFIFDIIFIITSKLNSTCNLQSNELQINNLIKKLIFFLQLSIYMFKYKIYKKINTVTMEMLNDEEILPIKQLNQLLFDISIKYCPIILTNWINLLNILNFNWLKLIINKKNNDINNENIMKSLFSNAKYKINSSINKNIIYQYEIILFCDKILYNNNNNNNNNNKKIYNYFLINNIDEIINCCHQQSINNLITNTFNNQLFIDTIVNKKINNIDNLPPIIIKKILHCLNKCHNNTSGSIIKILITKFLTTVYIVLTKFIVKIINERIEYCLTLTSNEELLSEQDIIELIKYFKDNELLEKHKETVELLTKLYSKWYKNPLELILSETIDTTDDDLKTIELNKKWFISFTELKCYKNMKNSIEDECANLLSNLDFESCNNIFNSNELNLKILNKCIKLGGRLTIENYTLKTSFVDAKDYIENQMKILNNHLEYLSPIYQSSVKYLFKNINSININIPKPHNIYDPTILNDNLSSKTLINYEYTYNFNELMKNNLFLDKLFNIIPGVISFMDSIKQFYEKDINYSIDLKLEDDYEQLLKLSILCLEMAHWMIYNHRKSKNNKLKPHLLELCLKCSSEILNYNQVEIIFNNEKNYTEICSAINSITNILEYFLSGGDDIQIGMFQSKYDYLPKIDKCGLKKAIENDKTKFYAEACLKSASLIAWLEMKDDSMDKIIPTFIKDKIKTLIVVTSRHELVNSFVLTPSLIWRHGCGIEGSGKTLCYFPLLLFNKNCNYLEELDILRQFVYKITLIGWTSRHQFEEIWMALLSVLSASTNEKTNDNDNDGNIIGVNIEVTSLAVQGITRLLMQTLLLPNPGNPINSYIIHDPRDPPLSLQKPSSKQLYIIQDLISWKYKCIDDNENTINIEHLFTRGNIERDELTNGYDYFSYSQLSVSYLWSLCLFHQDKLTIRVIKLKEKHEKSLSSNCLDLDSCIKFLIELYSRWMLPPHAGTPSKLLNQVVNSILSISELFIERSQFQWMFDSCWDMYKFYPHDDEILYSYLILCICKSGGVLSPLDSESLDKIKLVIDNGLKSLYFPCSMATLNGILYILQSNCHDDIIIINIINPLVIKYIKKYINSKKTNNNNNNNNILIHHSEDYERLIWTLIFFILEHHYNILDINFINDLLELSIYLISSLNISVGFHRTIIYGLERLIITKCIIGSNIDQIVKLSLDRLRQSSLLFSLPAFRLLLTCMYTEASDHFNRSITLNEEQPLPDIEPEALMKTIERTSAIFDRIKRGYPIQVQIFSSVLAQILGDFFPPFETLTKVIGEFLSPQQPHQQLMSAVVFKICEQIVGNKEQLTLLQDWVIFSLPNFIQSLPFITFTWCLSCFFISASTNSWLRAVFPYVQSRIGKYEDEDKKLLSLAALDFYRKLSNESQRRAFVESFSSEGDDQTPPSKFNDLLKIIN